MMELTRPAILVVEGDAGIALLQKRWCAPQKRLHVL